MILESYRVNVKSKTSVHCALSTDANLRTAHIDSIATAIHSRSAACSRVILISASPHNPVAPSTGKRVPYGRRNSTLGICPGPLGWLPIFSNTVHHCGMKQELPKHLFGHV